MKSTGSPDLRAEPTVPAASGADGGTREAVTRLLLEQGPVTAASVSAELGLTEAAVRRHLDALITAGQATTRQQARNRPRGRGRPAREYLLTDAGRVGFEHSYDDLAVAALRYLMETGGPDAVRTFAERRAAELVAEDRERIAAHGSVVVRAEELALTLTSRGYAADAQRAGGTEHPGAQLCQHHCPVAHVAAEFPELCEAETRAFADLLGTHVQRLATIARGDATCTTHVPLGRPEQARRRSTVPADVPVDTS